MPAEGPVDRIDGSVSVAHLDHPDLVQNSSETLEDLKNKETDKAQFVVKDHEISVTDTVISTEDDKVGDSKSAPFIENSNDAMEEEGSHATDVTEVHTSTDQPASSTLEASATQAEAMVSPEGVFS